MVTLTIKSGFFGKKHYYVFDFFALKKAVETCRLYTGELYTSDKITADQRFFYHCYGGWLKEKQHKHELMTKYKKIHDNLSLKNTAKLKSSILFYTNLTNQIKKALEK
jgi:hypothetical protein